MTMDIDDTEDIDIGFLTSLNLIATNQDDLSQEVSIIPENDYNCKFIAHRQVFSTDDISSCEEAGIQCVKCVVTENQSLPISSVITRIEEELSEEEGSLEKDTSMDYEFPLNEEEENSLPDSPTLTCDVCKSSFARLENLVKHLATRKHFNNINSKNMTCAAKLYCRYHHLLVKQSLYRCACCSFSPVDHNGLIVHLKSQQHRESIRALVGPAECTVCEYYDYDGSLMLDHCQSKEHLTLAINGCCIKEKRSNIKCLDCGKVLHATLQYASHRRKNHPSLDIESRMKLKQCRYCEYRGKPTALSQHYVKFHCDEKVYQCTACNSGFNFAYDLRQHRNTVKHVNSVLDTYVNKIRLSHLDGESQNLQKEVANVKDDASKAMQCKFCRYTTPVLTQLQAHYITHHEEKYPEEEKRESYETMAVSLCRFCDAMMSDQQLLSHELNHVEAYLAAKQSEDNRTSSGSRGCFVCSSNIPSPQYSKHVQEHGNRKLSARSKANLRSKIRPVANEVSGKERRHACPVDGCNRSYKTVGDLNVHKASHDSNKRYPCNQCEKAFPTKKQLKAHKVTHQALITFSCEYCEYRAKTKVHLTRHMRIHAGSRPYTCVYCEYSSTTIGNLRKHILKSKKHKGLAMYECTADKCSYISDTIKGLHSHMADEHDMHNGILMAKSTENDWTDVMEGHPILPVQH